MKKLVLSIFIALINVMLIAQVPQGFNYQAIARDNKGNPITNATIKVKLSILTDTTGFYISGGGTYLWEEEQTNVKTNAFGLITIVFGDPLATKIQGSVTSFGSINWSTSPLYLGTKIANTTDYKNLGSAKLWAVPYSIHAAKADFATNTTNATTVTNGVYTIGSYADPVWITSLSGTKISGTVANATNATHTLLADSAKAIKKGSKMSVVSSNDLGTDALFEVKRKDGQTVFAVYPDAVNIYVPRTAKGATKGGFAIGGFDQVKLGSQDYFRVTPDSVRIYIDKTPIIEKGATKGGFAIGGFDQVKGGIQDLLTVSNDSVRIYIDKTPIIKGTTKGGFAIGGFDQVKGGTQDLLTVSNDSIRMYINDLPGKGATKGGFAIGGFDQVKGGSIKYLRVTHDSTRIITADTVKGFGVSNLSAGNALGYLRLTPSNSFIGEQAGRSITTGLYNSILGYQSGFYLSSGTSNSFIGYKTGYSNSDGNFNVFIGNQAGFNNSNGSMNTFVGYISGLNNTIGFYNSFYGDSTGYSNTSGYNNTFIGGRSGFSNTTGRFNTFLGAMAGYSNNSNGYNTFVGIMAGYSNSGGSWNVALGDRAFYSNIDGRSNVSIGSKALYSNTSGDDNVANGDYALNNNTTGSYNVADGSLALSNNTIGTYNVGVGRYALSNNSAGNYNIAIGYKADVLSSNLENTTAIGYMARVGASNNMVFGNSSVVGWGFGVAPGTSAIKVGTSTLNGNGATLTLSGVWTNASDISKKYNIEDLNYGLNDVMMLHPVTYKLKGSNIQDVGFIAQEVKKIIPEIVYGLDGEMTLSYGQITSILTKAIQEQQHIIESQQKEIDELKTLVNSLVANQNGQGNK